MFLPKKLKDKIFYGWIVVIVILGISTITLGLRNSFGIFFKSLEGEFGLSRATTSGIISFYMFFGAVFAILGGWAIDRYGSRLV